jgi:hypothetical protein
MFLTKAARICGLIFVFMIQILLAGCGGGGGGGNDSTTAAPAAGPSSNTPEANISQLSAALKSDDLDATLGCFSLSDQKRMRAALEALDGEARKSLGEDLAKAQLIEQTPTTRIFRTMMDDGDGGTVAVRFGLILEEGKWVIWFM